MTADTCKKATGHKEEFTRLITRRVQDTSRRLPDSLRWCQDRLDTCRRLPDSLRRCKTVSQKDGAPAEDSKTVCDGAKTVWVPALDFHSLRRGQTVSQTGEAPAGDSQTV
ncbi:hypothetical protein DPMN_045087 [Dreissena polymorpha]|uniref:Uncharacterized protein n=1 Tax=Dreissena polymorpha TaxID=45954 RepID=A0A9D4D734_DREPO|nr:hypothetical protein DPMN_045087 [Dreissena polymorpha]